MITDYEYPLGSIAKLFIKHVLLFYLKTGSTPLAVGVVYEVDHVA